VAGTPVHQIVIGSCTNGRLDDIQIAARLLHGRRVASGTRLLVFPASWRIYSEAMRRGYLQDLVDAGAVVCNPGCGPCLGVHQGALGDGETALATTNRNFKGRMGNPTSEVYLCSTAVAAASAITGRDLGSQGSELTMARANVVLALGDDISTDIIYPGRYMATVLPTETPQFAFADHAEFNRKIKAGEIPKGSAIVAGANFGCGSSREQAASCLKGPELVVIARNIARIFLQNAINLGLHVVICPTIEAAEGDEVEVRPDASSTTRPAGRSGRVAAPGSAGHHRRRRLIPYTRRLMLERSAAL